MPKPSPKVTTNLSPDELLQVRGVIELLLGAAAFIVYVGTLAFRFVYDDRAQVLDNKLITSWSYVPGYFTHHVWALIDPRVAPNYYRPVFLLWLKLNYSLFTLSPAWWHAAAVALHIVATLQVFWLGQRLLRNRNMATVAALLFAVHPVHVESVAWVSGVTDPLLCVGMLGGVLGYLRWQQTRTAGSYVAALLLSCMALLSKEPSVILPLLITISAWTALERGKKLEWKPLVPFFLLAVAYLAIRQHVLRGFAHNMANGTVKEMVLTWPAVIAFYLRQLFLPYELSLFHSLPWVESPAQWRFWVPLAVVVLVLIGLGYAGSKMTDRRPLLASVAWIALPMMPLMYLRVYMEGEIVHDRYMYVSSVGAVLLLVVIAKMLLDYVPAEARFSRARAVAAVFVVGFAMLTFYNQMDWASDLLLFTHAIKVAPQSNVAMLNLGVIYAEKGDPQSLELAHRLFERVSERAPGNAAAWFNLGRAEYNMNDLTAAEQHIYKAVQLAPNYAPWWMHLAGIELRLGKFNEAEAAAQQALRLTPNEPGYHAALGAVYVGAHRFDLATQEFRRELQQNPDNANARKGLASIAASQSGATPQK